VDTEWRKVVKATLRNSMFLKVAFMDLGR